MKVLLHRINGLLSILLVVAGIAMLVSGDWTLTDESGILFILALFQIVMATVAGVVGLLFPKEGTKLSERAKKVLRIVLVLHAVLNKKAIGAYSVEDASVPRRTWEPIIPFVWLIFQAMLSIFAYSGTSRQQALVLLSLALLIVFFVTSLAWKVLDEKARGTYRLHMVLLPMLVVCVLIGGVLAYGMIRDGGREDGLQETKQQLAALQDIDPRPDETVEADEGDVLTPEELAALLRQDFPSEDVFYRLLEQEEDGLYLVAWSENSANVYVYQLEKREDAFVLQAAFASSSITKEDVLGREDGVLSNDS